MKKTFTDQMSRQVAVDFPPRRIVSLVPSQTELLYALGLAEEVVGITKFCVRPESWFRTKSRVGGTKQVNLQKVAELQPDLIIGNKEENTREQIEALAARFPVWMSDVHGLGSAIGMIRSLGGVAARETEAEALAAEIGRRFQQLEEELRGQSPIRAAYFIWRNPFMVSASGTFIDAMMQQAGLDNVFAHLSRYPEISLEELAAAQPQAILLSSEPYPFREKHMEGFRRACPESAIKLVNGEFFSWFGSRLLDAPAYFRALRGGLDG